MGIIFWKKRHRSNPDNYSPNEKKRAFPDNRRAKIDYAKLLVVRYPRAFLSKFGCVHIDESNRYNIKQVDSSILDYIYSTPEKELRELEERIKEGERHLSSLRVFKDNESKHVSNQIEKESLIIAPETLQSYERLAVTCSKALARYKEAHPNDSILEILAHKEDLAYNEVVLSTPHCTWQYAVEPSINYRGWKKDFSMKWGSFFYLDDDEIDDTVPFYHRRRFYSYGSYLLSYCKGFEWDHSFFPETEVDESKMRKIIDKEIIFINEVYDSLVRSTRPDINYLAVFANSEQDDDFNTFHFSYLKEKLNEMGVSYCDLNDENAIRESHSEFIHVIEFLSTRERSINNVKAIYEMRAKKVASIIYSSIIWVLTSEEMKSRINIAKGYVEHKLAYIETGKQF